MPTDRRFEHEPGSPDEPATVVVPGPLVVDPAPPGAPVVTDPVAVTEDLVVEEPLVGPADGEAVVGSHVVAESQSAVVESDGTVTTSYQRVEDETVVARRRPSWFWPFLALLALAVILGLLAWWYFSDQDSKQVPSVVGSSLTTAVNRLQQADFKSSIIRSTHPGAGRHRLRAGSVGIHRGEEGLGRPACGLERARSDRGPLGSWTVGRSRQAIARRCRPPGHGGAGLFEPGAGTVIAQNPPAGEKVASGQSVRINVSKGTGTAVVPNAVGLGEAAARSGIVAAGFRVTEARVPSTQSSGTVIAQYPVAGSRAADGTIVRINVAESASGGSAATTGVRAAAAGSASAPTSTSAAHRVTDARRRPASAPVPSVSGPVLGAAQRLAAAGFRVSLAYVPGTSALGTVVAQQPAAGSTAPTGSHVTVNVSAGRGQSAPATRAGRRRKDDSRGCLCLQPGRAPPDLPSLPGKQQDARPERSSNRAPPAGANAPKNAQILVYMGAYQKVEGRRRYSRLQSWQVHRLKGLRPGCRSDGRLTFQRRERSEFDRSQRSRVYSKQLTRSPG